MIKRLLLLLLAAIIVMYFMGCTERYETDLVRKSTTPCDSTGSYLKVQAIINTNCSNCHTNGVSSGLSYKTYNEVSGAAERIYERCTLPQSNSLFMPQNGNRLTDCELKVIKNWIDAGTPNN
jgi:uncharacterized membrane protein